MKFIDFDKEKCDECFKCLRTCPTKAISFKKHQREIVNDMCIKCGLCQQVCPQNALSIHSDIVKIKHLINTTNKVAVSLAPSFPTAFKTDKPLKIVTALRLLGFDIIEETGIGAEEVSKVYMKALKNWNQPNAITTCCPAANYFIEMYYPEEISKMLYVVSPMIAHGRMIKERYGKNTKVVFIGPCLAKKAEGKEIPGSIDGVLTFHELSLWLDDSSIDLEYLKESNFDQSASIHGKKYPMGAIASCEQDTKFEYVKAQGINQCKDMMEDLSKNKFDNLLIELNVCDGSCINGPDYPENESYFEKLSRMKNYFSNSLQNQDNSSNYIHNNIDLRRSFKNKKLIKETPSSEDLKEILEKIDKYDETDYLNCGACGYSSCFDKAKASYYNFSDITMCMPYLRSKAESLQSIIFDNTPNLIMILDKNLNVIDFNPAFRKIFNLNNTSVRKYNISDYIKNDIFRKIFESKSNIIGLKERFKEIDKVFIINLIYIESDDVVVSIMTDITSNEKNKEELSIVKGRTLKVCQEVINKQMRAAQEIASLLGETTAETKVNLNKLKDIVLEEDNTDYGI